MGAVSPNRVIASSSASGQVSSSVKAIDIRSGTGTREIAARSGRDPYA
jgi:hypothetical protein